MIRRFAAALAAVALSVSTIAPAVAQPVPEEVPPIDTAVTTEVDPAVDAEPTEVVESDLGEQALLDPAIIDALVAPAQSSPESAVSELLRRPTIFIVDRATGQPITQATYWVQMNNLETGDETGGLGPYSVNATGTWFSDQVWFNYPDGLVDGEPQDQFVLTEGQTPTGYKAITEQITITATLNGWEATGPVVETSPNTFVIAYDRAENTPGKPGTEDDPILLSPENWPTFVAVDARTGQTISGSYWGGETCTRWDNDLNWQCQSLDEYRMEMGRDGGMITDVIQYRLYEDHNFELINRMAPPGCSLNEESVWWKADENGTEVYGGGVYRLNDTTLAIPFDCENPTPVCKASDRPVHEVDPGSRYDNGTEGTIAIAPSIVRTDRSGRIVSGAVWAVDAYRQVDENTWERVVDPNTGLEVINQDLVLAADGEGIANDIYLEAGTYTFVVRESRPALGTTQREQSYVFTGTYGGPWTGYEGVTVNFDEDTGALTANTEKVVTDPQKQTLYRINEGDWAIGEPLNDPACAPAMSSGSSLWPLLLLPPALIGSSVAASSLAPSSVASSASSDGSSQSSAPGQSATPAPSTTPGQPAQPGTPGEQPATGPVGSPDAKADAQQAQQAAKAQPAQQAQQAAKTQPSQQAQQAQQRELARTGADVGMVIALALALIVAGGLIVRMRRA